MLGAWLVVTLIAAPAPAAEVQLEGERLLHDGKARRTTVEGRARLAMEGLRVDADRIVYSEQTGTATAVGNVVARLVQGGKTAIVAELVTIHLDDAGEVRELFVHDGKAWAKKDVTADVLLATSTREGVEAVGATQMLLTGNHLVRDGPRWKVGRAELVPCECDWKNPSWSVISQAAIVDTEHDRVTLLPTSAWPWEWPLVRLGPVKLPLLGPVVSLPLTDRQSGLLFPRPNYTQLNGFSFEQPVFLTLGRSADVTLTPGFFTGAPAPQGPYGLAGPRLLGELRYVPSHRASGRLVLGALYDFRLRRDVELPAQTSAERRGLRGEWSWQHTQDLDRGFGLRVDVNGHSDGDYNRDVTPDVIASAATYLRSTVSAFQRGPTHSLSLDVGLRQDIQWGYDWLGQGLVLSNEALRPRYGPGTLQRLPALTVAWAPDARLGPVRFDVSAEAVRLAPLFSNTGDEGQGAREGADGLHPGVTAEPFACAVERLFAPAATPSAACGITRVGLGDRLWRPGEREARDRLSVLPRFSFGTSLFGVASVSGFAAWRQLAWLGEASGRTWSRGYPLLGVRLETQLARTFAGGVRHVVQPSAELRSVPLVVAGSNQEPSDPLAATPVAYDEVDAALPGGLARTQAAFELRNRLGLPGAPDWLRLDLGQGLELAAGTRPPSLAESWARLSSTVGWVSLAGTLRVDPQPATGAAPELTRLSGRLEVDDGRGHGAYAAYENILMEGTARTRQPIDLLFLRDRFASSSTRVQLLSWGARWNFGPAALRYEGLLQERVLTGATTAVPVLAQQTLGLAITPACDCWRIELYGVVRTDGAAKLLPPDFGFSFTANRFGSIGGGAR